MQKRTTKEDKEEMAERKEELKREEESREDKEVVLCGDGKNVLRRVEGNVHDLACKVHVVRRVVDRVRWRALLGLGAVVSRRLDAVRHHLHLIVAVHIKDLELARVRPGNQLSVVIEL